MRGSPAALATVLAALALGCGGEGKAPPPPTATVQGDAVVIPPGSPQLGALVVEAVQARVPPVRQYNGRLAWDDEVTVRIYPPVAGRVAKVLAEVGAQVTAGQPLAVIDSPDFGQAQADARDADGALQLAERTRARARDLFEHGAGPKKDVDNAEADWSRAKAEVERTQARLRLYAGQAASVDEMLQLRSPIAGIVADRAVARGQEVRPDQMLASEEQATRPLFVITDPTRLWLWLDVAEVDLAGFRPGQVLTLRARAYPDRQFQGRVDLVGASLDPATRTVRVRGLVRNPDGALKAEMYVTADVTDPAVAAPGVEVPSKAIYLDGDRRWVFVEESSGRFRRRAVTLGPEHDGRSAVTDGLMPGERVVTEGNLLLQQIMDAASAG